MPCFAETDGEPAQLAYAGALLPLSLAPTLIGMAGPVYFALVLVLSLIFLWLSIVFARSRSAAAAVGVEPS